MNKHEVVASELTTPQISGAETSRSAKSGGTEHDDPRPWQRAFLRFGPLSGMSGLGLALASIVASAGILVGSNGSPTSGWTTPPSTYLAIFTAVANLAMRYACIQGVAIAWWNRALSGATLDRLHHDWRSGTTIRGAVTSGRLGLLGLACISSTIVFIDGPLLQKSTSVRSTPILDRTLPLNVRMVPEMPTGFSGYWFHASELGVANNPSDLNWNATIPTDNGSAPNNVFSGDAPMFGNDNVYRLWSSNSPLPGVVQGCPQGYGTRCRAKLRAPALAIVGCAPHTVQVNYSVPYSRKEFSAIFDAGAPRVNSFAFMVSLEMGVSADIEQIGIVTGFSQTKNCTGHFQYTACTLESALGEYDITINNDAVTLDSPGNPRIISRASNAQVDHTVDHSVGDGIHHSTLGGIVSMAYSKWFSAYVIDFYQGAFVQSQHGSIYRQFASNINLRCPDFTNPQSALIADLNSLMVYAGAYAARQDPSALDGRLDPGLEVNTTTVGTLEGDHNVFSTDYNYFVGAALVEFICIALVLPTYWAWWRIGRPMSFSPLEMAKAFQSPLVSDQYSNSSARELAKATEGHMVKYGIVRLEGGGTKLGFADPSMVDRPHGGSVFDA